MSTWNDVANNNPGAGNIIWQCQANGQVAPFANITLPADSKCLRDGAGIGVTMALNYCGGVVIVGSTPIKDPATGLNPPQSIVFFPGSGNALLWESQIKALLLPWTAQAGQETGFES